MQYDIFISVFVFEMSWITLEFNFFWSFEKQKNHLGEFISPKLNNQKLRKNF